MRRYFRNRVQSTISSFPILLVRAGIRYADGGSFIESKIPVRSSVRTQGTLTAHWEKETRLKAALDFIIWKRSVMSLGASGRTGDFSAIRRGGCSVGLRLPSCQTRLRYKAFVVFVRHGWYSFICI